MVNEPKTLVELVNLRSRGPTGSYEFVAACFLSCAYDLPDKARAKTGATLRLIHEDVLKQAEWRFMKIIGHDIEVGTGDLSAILVDRKANATCGVSLSFDIHRKGPQALARPQIMHLEAVIDQRLLGVAWRP
jgi:hypothetical protein